MPLQGVQIDFAEMASLLSLSAQTLGSVCCAGFRALLRERRHQVKHSVRMSLDWGCPSSLLFLLLLLLVVVVVSYWRGILRHVPKYQRHHKTCVQCGEGACLRHLLQNHKNCAPCIPMVENKHIQTKKRDALHAHVPTHRALLWGAGGSRQVVGPNKVLLVCGHDSYPCVPKIEH